MNKCIIIHFLFSDLQYMNSRIMRLLLLIILGEGYKFCCIGKRGGGRGAVLAPPSCKSNFAKLISPLTNFSVRPCTFGNGNGVAINHIASSSSPPPPTLLLLLYTPTPPSSLLKALTCFMRFQKNTI